MKQQKNDHHSKFWVGFAMGTFACGAFAMAMGTKKGRTMIKKTMDYMENLEDTPDHLNTLTDIISSFTKLNSESAGKAQNNKEEAPKKADKVENATSITSIIEKMKSITSDKKSENKFFIKPNKK